MSQLILLNDSYEHGDEDAFPDDLVSGARRLMEAAERLVTAAQTHSAATDDEVK